ncbi:hypothetical protein HDU76_008256 [Blyttiomyces sp. JEL0837]|nr:hypothetical protein HDU76_008256 [Blyttiomyces sp. JEL0837]
MSESSTSSTSIISTLIKSTPTCNLTPKAFFIAWNGVLTLAFEGFPSPIVNLKTTLNNDPLLTKVLSPENSGSKWPKTTLGALSTNTSLTLDELKLLSTLCTTYSTRLQQQHEFKLPIKSLSFVEFACRSLESIVFRGDVDLMGHAASGGVGGDLDVISQDQQDIVNKVLGESDPIEEYFKMVDRLGYRINHYREPCAQSTLVSFWKPSISEIPSILNKFRNAVDQLLPGKYHWMNDDSLHVTVRCVRS